MASIITEIHVSNDGVNYTKLDTYKDEPINKNYKQLDLKELSKVFAPFSQSFTLPATPKNRRAFGYFGDTDVIKNNKESKYRSKTYINGVLHSTGFLNVNSLSYKNNKPVSFTAEFATSITNLKDRIGDDLISDLVDETVSIIYNDEYVSSYIDTERTKIVNGVEVKYFVPLISVNRVWGYDNGLTSLLLDNIAYKENASLQGNNFVKSTELRPCISYSSIINLIKQKYDINVVSPLELRDEFTDLRVWCNAEVNRDSDFEVLPILKAFGSRRYYDGRNEGGVPSDKKYTVFNDVNTNTFKVNKTPNLRAGWIEDAFQFRIKFNNVVVFGDESNAEAIIQCVRASDDIVLASGSFALEQGKIEAIFKIDDDFFINDSIEYYVRVKFTQPLSWRSCDYRVYWNYYDGRTGVFSRTVSAWYYHDSVNNINSFLLNTNNIDLFKSLPEMKVSDFLSSHFKMFNISIYENSFEDDSLYWLTPDDINTVNNEYSKKTLDYTNYISSKDFKKEKPTDFNSYNFKHGESEYFSNKSFFKQTGKEYGQATYPEIKEKKINEFKIETVFSIIPPVNVNGASGLITAYGFNSDTPEIINTGETRYTPNYGELTIFYTHGVKSVSPYGFLYQLKRVVSKSSYIRVMPWTKGNKSLGFSIINDKADTLFLRYYEDQTIRLLNPNVLKHEYDLFLPPKEMYLNKGNTITPDGFRLQNDVIIGDNIFSILEANIDETTGKTKLTLLNY